MTPLFYTRRRVLRNGLTLGLTGPLLAPSINAQSYPVKPITIISPFSAGGADAVLRLMTPRLSELLRQPIVIENVVGASGLIGAERVARSTPDGYTLLFAPSSASVTAPLMSKQSRVDIVRNFTPIISMNDSAQTLFVHPSLQVNSVPELIAYARANPEKVAFGSAGVGSVMHLNGEQFNQQANVKMVHVPFRGISVMMNDTLAGRVQVGFSTLLSTQGFFANGKLKPLAVLADRPSPFLPGLPAITDSLPKFQPSSLWTCLLAPAGLPVAIQMRLNQAMRETLTTSEVRRSIEQDFGTILALSPEETTNRLKREIAFTLRLMKETGIEPE